MISCDNFGGKLLLFFFGGIWNGYVKKEIVVLGTSFFSSFFCLGTFFQVKIFLEGKFLSLGVMITYYIVYLVFVMFSSNHS